MYEQVSQSLSLSFSSSFKHYSTDDTTHNRCLAKLVVVRHKVESRLPVELDALLVRGTFGETVTAVGEHEAVELELGDEDLGHLETVAHVAGVGVEVDDRRPALELSHWRGGGGQHEL